MADDPLALFDAWYAEAKASEPNDPNAMTLATVGPGGRPSARIVLLKEHGADGFVFYTNRQSRKGQELDDTRDASSAGEPYAALVLHWKSLRRQVRIEGPVSRATDAQSDAYWASRGRDSQLGAWASDQSQPLDARETFEARVEAARARFEGQDVPRPAHWGGYVVAPERIEFWQDRAHRLHERRLFVREPEARGGGWSEGLLFP